MLFNQSAAIFAETPPADPQEIIAPAEPTSSTAVYGVDKFYEHARNHNDIIFVKKAENSIWRDAGTINGPIHDLNSLYRHLGAGHYKLILRGSQYIYAINVGANTYTSQEAKPAAPAAPAAPTYWPQVLAPGYPPQPFHLGHDAPANQNSMGIRDVLDIVRSVVPQVPAQVQQGPNPNEFLVTLITPIIQGMISMFQNQAAQGGNTTAQFIELAKALKQTLEPANQNPGWADKIIEKVISANIDPIGHTAAVMKQVQGLVPSRGNDAEAEEPQGKTLNFVREIMAQAAPLLGSVSEIMSKRNDAEMEREQLRLQTAAALEKNRNDNEQQIALLQKDRDDEKRRADAIAAENKQLAQMCMSFNQQLREINHRLESGATPAQVQQAADSRDIWAPVVDPAMPAPAPYEGSEEEEEEAVYKDYYHLFNLTLPFPDLTKIKMLVPPEEHNTLDILANLLNAINNRSFMEIPKEYVNAIADVMARPEDPLKTMIDNFMLDFNKTSHEKVADWFMNNFSMRIDPAAVKAIREEFIELISEDDDEDDEDDEETAQRQVN